MHLGDVYVNMKTKEIIQISCFARHMDSFKNMLIIYNKMFNNGGDIGFSPSGCGYGKSVEEIEEKYSLLVSDYNLNQYKSWEEIFKLVE